MNWAKAFHTLKSFLESKSQNSVRTPNLGTHLPLPAPRGQASATLSVPTAATGGAANSPKGSHRDVRPLSMTGHVYRAGA